MLRKFSFNVDHFVSGELDGNAGHCSIISDYLLRKIPFCKVGSAVATADAIFIVSTSLLSGVAYQVVFLKTFGNIEQYSVVGALVAVIFCACLASQGNYTPTRLVDRRRQVVQVTIVWLAICGFVAAVAFTLKVTTSYSRGSTIMFFFCGWVGLVAGRIWIASVLARALREGSFARQKFVLIQDGGYPAEAGLAELNRFGFRPIQIVELGDVPANQFEATLHRCITDISEAIRNEAVDCVLLSSSFVGSDRSTRMLHALRGLPISVYLLPEDSVIRFAAHGFTNIGSVPLGEVQRPPLTTAEQIAKRMLDVVLAGLAMVFLCPLLLIVAVLIKLDTPGQVIFRQKRNGVRGSQFLIYKFRTMTVMEDGDRVVQARRNDTRVTRVGKLLRKTSIDELPQLFNVLKGDMSIVGPRPHALSHNHQYEKVVADYAARHNVKPGITGWAQINGLRGETPTVDVMARRVEHDLWYIDHWSFWLDLWIILKTIWIVYRQPTAF